ncbi:Por secretion system C-terminal sorting domain-containing protein [Catalinimonas alkaloidigena]|uniref:Por secretion system C-terminal sorting domain-containing protein n=1 Tax=Catalinimonas alkaloidigena TaxID=1075417 RepID=A0A1G9T7N8_9BACT|nr:DUF5060 domain-containing protein [Catalinimonas alkaloidigena]SDM43684.1 Por secretion system C-terminal sorting domain-containing protein [Catalinimonas alkaloidigena]
MNHHYLLVCVWLLLTTSAHAVDITDVAFTATTVPVFGRAEATFSLSTSYTNPYDPDEVQVDALISTPSGATLTMPCFYHVPTTFNATGDGWNAPDVNAATWQLRFTPMEVGAYSVTIQVTEASGLAGTSAPVTLDATDEGAAPGFVRLDATNPQFMRFDNGVPYYPVGLNVSWNSGNLAGFYHDYLDHFAPGEITWMRYWLAGFARQAIEWGPNHWSNVYAGLGRYSPEASVLLDSVLNLCAEKGIYLQLVLQHHGQVSTNVNPNWDENPYNSANGGYLSNPADFFTNADAIAQTKKLYRYIVARWGYSPNILSWELFNEVEYTDGTDAAIDAWHNTMSTYLHDLDPHGHLVSTSTGQDNSTMPLLQDNAALDQVQYHIYASNVEQVIYNQGRSFIEEFDKPVLCGEFGTNNDYTGTNHPDRWGDHVRKTQWIGAMSENPSLFWYWDYVDRADWYGLFAPLSSYWQGEDVVMHTGGQAQQFGFTQAANATTTLTLVPGNANWDGYNDPNPFVIDVQADGSTNPLAGFSSYLQGSWRADRNREVQIQITLQDTSTLQLVVAEVSASGSKIIDVYDGNNLLTSWTMTAGGTYALPGLTAGTHTFRLYNRGEDWINLASLRFTNVAINQARAYGYQGPEHAYGYVTDQSYGEWADPATVAPLAGVKIRLAGMTPFQDYVGDFYDPKTGQAMGSAPVALVEGSTDLELALPPFVKDVAFKVHPGTTSRADDAAPEDRQRLRLYPNPATQSTVRVRFSSEASGLVALEVFTPVGTRIFATPVGVQTGQNEVSLEVATWPVGLYFVRIGDGAKALTGKLLKQ